MGIVGLDDVVVDSVAVQVGSEQGAVILLRPKTALVDQRSDVRVATARFAMSSNTAA